MSDFNVVLYAVVRVKVSGIEAESMEHAIDKAQNGIGLHELLQHDGNRDGDYPVEYAEYAENIVSATVDVCGDDDFVQSRDFHYSGDWKPGDKPRVLVSVAEGVTEINLDEGVDVCIVNIGQAADFPKLNTVVPPEFSDLNDWEIVEYGPSIATLVKKLEAGEFR